MPVSDEQVAAQRSYVDELRSALAAEQQRYAAVIDSRQNEHDLTGLQAEAAALEAQVQALRQQNQDAGIDVSDIPLPVAPDLAVVDAPAPAPAPAAAAPAPAPSAPADAPAPPADSAPAPADASTTPSGK